MVESGNIATVFFGQFDSPYVGSPFMVSGNQIYSAIIREKGLTEAQEALKVSHGIFHTIVKGSVDWKGWHVSDKANINEKTIKTYGDFFQLRSYNTPFIKDTNEFCDYDRWLRSHRVVIGNGDKIDMFFADKISFFIVADHEIKIDELSLGAKRNLGFGHLTIVNTYSFNIDSLDFSEFGNDDKLIETAKNGITGILNHKKYGYGEYQIEQSEKSKDKYWIRLTTPLCLSSTIEGSRNYTTPPPFMVGNVYRKHRESIWRKGKVESLYCVSDGGVFLYGG